LPLAVFGALPVNHVQCGGIVIAAGQRGAYAGIHASAQEHDCPGFCGVSHRQSINLSNTF
jgi:hypothetical protein